MPFDLSDSDLDAVASLTVKDVSMGVVLAVSMILMVMPFVFIVLASLPDRRKDDHPDDTREGSIR